MDNSPLRKLPPEVRNIIYDLALRSKTGDCHITSTRHRPLVLVRGQDNRLPLALTQACRAIRQETRDTFFAVNNFVVKVNPGKATLKTSQFRSFIGEDREHALRRITICTDVIDCRCNHGRPARICASCDRFLRDLKKLYKWSLAHGRVAVKLKLKSMIAARCFPADMKHLCTSDKAKTPAYLVEYKDAFLGGWLYGDWESYEKLTGLKVGCPPI